MVFAMAIETFDIPQTLPSPLPDEPMPLLKSWFDEAVKGGVQPNPNAMTVATVDPDGRPSVRVVLCRGMEVGQGFVVFFSNRLSRKGKALAANPRAAADFFWDPLGRQAIVEGRVVESPAEESDKYFNGRPLESRIGSWASEQSRPIESREALVEKIMAEWKRFGVDPARATEASIPRPPHWGGYRIWVDRVELWVSGPGRAHDRAAWTRELAPGPDGGFRGGPWSATRLQP